MFVRVGPGGRQLGGELPERGLEVADLVLQLVDPLGLLPDHASRVLRRGRGAGGRGRRPVHRVVALQLVVRLLQLPQLHLRSGRQPSSICANSELMPQKAVNWTKVA